MFAAMETACERLILTVTIFSSAVPATKIISGALVLWRPAVDPQAGNLLRGLSTLPSTSDNEDQSASDED